MPLSSIENRIEDSQQHGRHVRYGTMLVLWLAQLVIPLTLLVYVLFRWHRQMPFRWWVVPLTVCCVSWIVVVVTSVASTRGREWLATNSRQILLASIACVITLAICDVALTVGGRVPTLATLRSQSLLYRPGVSTRHRLVPSRALRNRRGTQVNINRRGFRGGEIPIPKPADETYVLILGGSQVFDFEGSDWPSLVEKQLSPTPVRVINAGVPGHCTVDSLGKLTTDLWMAKPDIIVLCQAWNDLKYFSEIKPSHPYSDYMRVYGGDPRTMPSGMDRWLCVSSIYRLGRGSFWATLYGEEGIMLKPNRTIDSWGLQQYRLNVESICDVGRNLDARVLLCKQARLATSDSSESDRARIGYGYAGLPHDEMVRAFAECDKIIEHVAGTKNCRVIDMHKSLSGRAELFLDHIHFSPAGSQEAARIVADAIENL